MTTDDSDQNAQSAASKMRFDVKRQLAFPEFFRPGMGTELVAPFLYSLVRMVRPERVLEIGAGYTTVWLASALEDNADVLIDWNCDHRYFQSDYQPTFVCVDRQSENPNTLSDLTKWIEANETVSLLNADYMDVVDQLKTSHSDFDFVWFDCGGPDEYAFFCEHYLPFCSGIVLLHFTYSYGKPNMNHDIISDCLSKAPNVDADGKCLWSQMDLVEPHKFRQGSVTMLQRHSYRAGPADNKTGVT